MKHTARWANRWPVRGDVAAGAVGSLSPRSSRGRCAGRNDATRGRTRQRVGSRIKGQFPRPDEKGPGRRRPARLNLRLTEEEERQIRHLAEGCGLSAPRYLIEAGLARSASDAANRRRVEWDLGQARVVLKAAGNNLNQLAKWANANRALPAHVEAGLGQVQRAVEVVEKCARAVASEFTSNR
jgi:hypothetical protein